MKKILIILAVITGLILITLGVLYFMMPKQAKAPRKISGRDELDHYFRLITDESTPPSVNIAVLKGGEPVYLKAFGMADGPRIRPARTETIYPWWSATKLFTATAVLKLADEKLLDLDDPVRAYLPDYNIINSEGTPVKVTIRELLNHRSGLPDIIPEGLSWVHMADEPPIGQTQFFNDRIITDFSTVEFTPGTEVQYSNTGYIVLGVIIEKVTGRSYEDYVTEEIIGPLNLDSTSFYRSEELQSRTATGSQPVIDIFTVLLKVYGERGFLKKSVREKVDRRMWFYPLYTDYTPSTGLSGTAADLALFGNYLMSGTGPEGQRIVNPDLLKEMQRPFTIKELERKYGKGEQFGYGLKSWHVKGEKVYGHGGGGPGFGTILAFVPERDLVISVVANDTNLKRDEVIRAIMEIDW